MLRKWAPAGLEQCANPIQRLRCQSPSSCVDPRFRARVCFRASTIDTVNSLKESAFAAPGQISLRNGVASKLRIFFALALLSALALLVHGYHPYAEDAEIYLPGVLKILNPRLFPTNAEFFGEHAGHTLYPNLIALSVRATHLPLPWIALLWQMASIFLLLAASWRLTSVLFGKPQPNARFGGKIRFELSCFHWGAASLMAALLTLPLAGTTLYILDQFLNPRNLAAFAALFAVAETLDRKYLQAALWLAFAAAVHPFMSSFAILFCIQITKHGKTGW